MLDLDNNKLIDLPEEISKLTNLRILSLSNNRLSNLPKTINKMVNLRELFLDGNPWSKEIEYDDLPNLSGYCKDRLDELNEEISVEAPIRRKETTDLLLQAKQREIPVRLKNGKISGDARNYYELNEEILNSDIMGFLGHSTTNPNPPSPDTFINNAINKANTKSSSSDAKGGRRRKTRKTVRKTVRRKTRIRNRK